MVLLMIIEQMPMIRVVVLVNLNKLVYIKLCIVK